MKQTYVCVLFLLALVLPSLASAQTTAPIQNPTLIAFTPSPDHANIAAYQVIIMQGATVVQTLDIGKPNPCAASCPAGVAVGEASAVINVQPINFGSYTIVMKAVAQGITGPASTPTDPWERAPGPPGGKPKVR